jgi:hypothetical protein
MSDSTSGSGGGTPPGPAWGQKPESPGGEPGDPPAAPSGPAWGEPAQPPASPPATPDAPATPGWGQPPAQPAAPSPAPATPSPAGAPPPTATGWGSGKAPPPAETTGASGCMKLGIILLIAVVVALIAFAFIIGQLFSNFGTNLGVSVAPGAGSANGGDCSFLSDADARTIFGGNADAIDLSGLYDASIGLIIDKRVLSNAPDCWVTEGDRAYIARIALYQGGDASSLFQAEKTAAEPTSDDQGGGVSIENPGYLASEVKGLGDEAFCTDISGAIMAGVLVRQGDRLVYVSVGPASESDPSVSAPDLCTVAQEAARFILR